MWLRIGTWGGLLWTQKLTFVSHKMEFSWVVVLLDSQEGICSMELGRFRNYGYESYRLLLNFKVGKAGNRWSFSGGKQCFSFTSPVFCFSSHKSTSISTSNLFVKKSLCLLYHWANGIKKKIRDLDARTIFLQLIRFLQSVMLNLYYTFFLYKIKHIFASRGEVLTTWQSCSHLGTMHVWNTNTNVSNRGRNAVEGQVIMCSQWFV